MDEKIHKQYDAVILAAGLGSRYQGTSYKLVEMLNGIPVIRKTAEAVLGANFRKVVLVCGFQSQMVIDAVRGLNLRIDINNNWKNGQSSSMICGVNALGSESRGACFVLGDQPLIRSETLNQLCQAAECHPGRIVAPGYNGKRGNPCLFPSCFFPELLSVSGDFGGREILKKEGFFLMETNDPGIFFDIDTLEDFKKL